MKGTAIVFEAPQRIAVNALSLSELGQADVQVEIDYSGVSTGTEKMLWDGSMPNFPGMGYPLVPGYEAIGRVVAAGSDNKAQALIGQQVFVPGAKCYGDVRGLFGGAASRVIVPAQRVSWLGAASSKFAQPEDATLLALAATAHHAVDLASANRVYPELIVGHGILGRLIARVMLAKGLAAPTVWEISVDRMQGADGYKVIHPNDDARRDYQHVCDASGDSRILNLLMQKLGFGGVITLAGFYNAPLQFDFAPAFMREAQIKIAAQWQPLDLDSVIALVCSGHLDLGGLVTHNALPRVAQSAYRTAFEDAQCLKMVIDWRQSHE